MERALYRPAYVPFIQHAKTLGIDVGKCHQCLGVGTGKVDAILEHMTWIRFTVAGTAEELCQDHVQRPRAHPCL
jgi:hypothetical protein